MAKTIKINESFTCQNCSREVAAALQTCRNHCPYCLCSLHVDGNVPGDRASSCHGLMKPISIEHRKKGLMILHQCEDCGFQRYNKILEDDDWEVISELSAFGS